MKWRRKLNIDKLGGYTLKLDCYEDLGCHPQEFMKEVGITYKESRAYSVYDCWVFYGCQGLPDTLPSKLKEFEDEWVEPY